MMDLRRQRLLVLLLVAQCRCAAISIVRSLPPSSGYCIGTQCFALYKERSDFRVAQSLCRDQWGHLMTVRTSAANDALMRMANFSGRVWIGLNLATECPDADAKLKGFQWVIKDSESDFSNWEPGFDHSCSAPRCVSVSAEGNFLWRQEACGGVLDGFLCEYSIMMPCGIIPVEAGETVSYVTPLGFGGEHLVVLPQGSTAVRRPLELKYSCSYGSWEQAPWSCGYLKGGCEHGCVDSHSQPTCYCPLGQTVNRLNNVTCEADAQDPCMALRCDYACYRDGDAYKCICDRGFMLAEDGRSCVDIYARENAECVNRFGRVECTCRDGFRLQGSVCVDEDECASAPCEQGCTNTPGSYKCSCFSGYKADPGDPHRCVLHCGEEECPAECDPNNQNQCDCPSGSVAEGRDTGTVCVKNQNQK